MAYASQNIISTNINQYQSALEIDHKKRHPVMNAFGRIATMKADIEAKTSHVFP